MPKQLAAAERVPLWFERYHWFLSSSGDLVVSPKDAGQADVLLTKFANLNEDVAVLCDAPGAWPTLVKPRVSTIGPPAIAATGGTGGTTTSTTTPLVPPRGVAGDPRPETFGRVAMSMASLREAGAAAVCRSTGWAQKAQSRAWYCHAAALTKLPPGCGGRPLPQGQWFAAPDARGRLDAFSLQLCVALVALCDADQPVPARPTDTVQVEPPVAAGSAATTPVAAAASKTSPATAPMDRRDSSTAFDRATSTASSATASASSPSFGGGSNSKSGAPNANAPRESETAQRHRDKKAKLILKKYGEQDDEDRAVALQLLGNKKSKAQELVEAQRARPPQPQPQPPQPSENDSAAVVTPDGSAAAAASDSAAPDGAPTPSGATATAAPPRRARNANVEDAVKNLADKVGGAAAEVPRMRYLGREAAGRGGDDGDEQSQQQQQPASGTVRHVVPVCVPVLTMPTNKCRVLIVPGGEKRGELAKEVLRAFVAPMAAHAAAAWGDAALGAAIAKIALDDVLQQLPQTAKVQTPFRASMIPASATTTTSAAPAAQDK